MTDDDKKRLWAAVEMYCEQRRAQLYDGSLGRAVGDVERVVDEIVDETMQKVAALCERRRARG